ncbi:Protein C32D5.12 [Aphelenchoides avenae]|nr:Protein C32D5.12 [Aphelenchus avenae]
MVKVVVTGGSGFIASHLVKYLQENASDLVTEIRTVDRKPFHSLYARKRLEFFFTADQDRLHEQYLQDNLNATEVLVDTMMDAGVSNLVYVGDAFANLPPGDNFGNSEDIHSGAPSSYLLGEYGETRTRAELYVRKKNGKRMKNGKTFHTSCLRPTLVYGEGDHKMLAAIDKIARSNNGPFPHFSGDSCGMLQYIHAGNLAALMMETMCTMLSTPERCAGDFFYCMDDSSSLKVHQFFRPIIEALGHEVAPTASSYWAGWTSALWNEFKGRWLHPSGFAAGCEDQLSIYAHRLLFTYALGFSQRKQVLMLTYRPKTTQEETVERTAQWVRQRNLNGRNRG